MKLGGGHTEGNMWGTERSTWGREIDKFSLHTYMKFSNIKIKAKLMNKYLQ